MSRREPSSPSSPRNRRGRAPASASARCTVLSNSRGGHIKIYSEPGQGTSIKLYLPRFYGVADSPKQSVAQTLVGGGQSEVVLLVEDDQPVLELTAHMLRDLGYGVLEA